MNAKETQNILNNHIPKQRFCNAPSLVMLFFTRTFHGEPSLAGHREALQELFPLHVISACITGPEMLLLSFWFPYAQDVSRDAAAFSQRICLSCRF
jgi:hypothetical protein